MFDENKKFETNEEEVKKCDDPACDSHCKEEPTKDEGECCKIKHKKEVIDKAEYDKINDLYLKALNTAAHHENLSKYYRNEYDKIVKYRSQYVIETMLPALDGFQLAFKYEAPTKEAQNYRLGFEFVYKLLLGALTNEGMSEIVPKVGDHYDPFHCQVVDTVETNEEAKVGLITEVLLSGYKFKDRVIRPANIKIFALKKNDAKNSVDGQEPATKQEIKN